MAAAVPQPVMVGSPIGAPTADCPIYLDANSPVVLATPCLNWQPAPAGPGGQARMQLMTFQAVSAFLPPCSTSRTAVDQAAANAVNVLISCSHVHTRSFAWYFGYLKSETRHKGRVSKIQRVSKFHEGFMVQIYISFARSERIY